MSRRLEPHYAKGQGIIAVRSVGVVFERGAAAPSNSVAGFAPGCLFVNTSGTVGSVLYVNVGTAASSTWLNIA